MTPHIYCDLDGVLANFVAGANHFFDMDIERENTAFNELWDRPDGWERLKDEWPTFWMDLDPMPHAMPLWHLIAPEYPSILTAHPTGWTSAATGKYLWCKRHLPGFGQHPMQTFHAVERSRKKHFARQEDGTSNILIDDYEKNIREWERAGGIGVLYVDGPAGLTDVREMLAQLNK